MHLILAFFHQVQGPTILFATNPILANEISKTIDNLLDIAAHTGFFQYSSEEQDIFLANLSFQIPSMWARGRAEHLMISIVIDPLIDPKKFRRILENFCEDIKKIPNAYKGLYLNTTKEDPEILAKYQAIQTLFEELAKKCANNLSEVILGNFLIMGLAKVGKSSIATQLTSRIYDPNIRPTLGIQITKVFLENYRFELIDVGGQVKFRDSWKQRIIVNPNAIVYVIDCTADEKETEESASFFEDVITYFKCKDEKVPILILANKSDLVSAYKVEEAEKILNPKKHGIVYHVGITSALKNQGILKSFRWLINYITDKEPIL